MVGMFLKERDVQYVAHRDETTQTWRILDTWHESLMDLGPEDEIPDDSPGVMIITEGAFIALIKEGARLGVIQNASFSELLKGLHKGVYVASFLITVLCGGLFWYLFQGLEGTGSRTGADRTCQRHAGCHRQGRRDLLVRPG